MKFSKYSMVVRVDKGLVIYNSRNGKFANIFNEPDLSHFKELIKTDIYPDDDNMVQKLYEQRYLVDDDKDEYLEVKNSIEEHYKNSLNNLRIMLYVTDNCNFRCIYCGQKHEASSFSDEKWKALYKYMEKIIKKELYKTVSISLFGGEPLLKVNKILEFMEKVNDLCEKHPKTKVLYSMTSNGYLLTPDVYDRMTTLGLKSIQITVDGFAETHNKMRCLVDGSPTWDKIINNLEYINSVDDKVQICFRTNCNDMNLSTINDFYNWATEKFDNKKISFDIEPIAKFSNIVNDEVLSKQKKEDLEKFIKKYERYTSNPKANLVPLGQVCSCAENFYIISTNGDLSKCEQAYDDVTEPVGYLSDDGEFVFNKNIKDWTANFETINCPDCFIYPLCAGRKCMRKKVKYPKNRPDCDALYENVKENIVDLICTGYLDKNHESIVE